MQAVNNVHVNSAEYNADRWRRFVWLALVALTLGLCLLAHKRQAEHAYYAAVPVNEIAQEVKVYETPQLNRMVVRVQQVSGLPIWASGTLDSDVMHDQTYDRA